MGIHGNLPNKTVSLRGEHNIDQTFPWLNVQLWVIFLGHKTYANNGYVCYYNGYYFLFRSVYKQNVRNCFKRYYRSWPIFALCDNKTFVVIDEDPTLKYKRKLDKNSLNKYEHDTSVINLGTVYFQRCLSYHHPNPIQNYEKER